MKKFFINLFCTLTVFTLLTISFTAAASDFSVPFVNAAGLGNIYAGWAAEADDASTAYSNPAGLVRLHCQQMQMSVLGVNMNTKFTGTTTPPSPPFPPQTGTASGSNGALLPYFYYAIPVNNRIVFAFGETIPFGLGTNYAKDSIVRYGATRSLITDTDVGPSVGIKITDQFSVGAGFDVNYLFLSLNSMVGNPPFFGDVESQNHMRDWGFGWHAGALYQFTPCTRMGFNYRSPVVFHLTGDSKIFFPGGAQFRTTQLKANLTLPALAQLGLYHDITKRWAVMGTVFYTNWAEFDQVTLQNVMGPDGFTFNNTVPFNYHDTFDYAVGVNFKATDKLLFRTGVQYLSAPSNDRDRIIADPISTGTVVGIGAQYRQNCHFAYDIAYAHVFFAQTAINHITPFATEIGHSNTQNNVFAGQITWYI
jgi:long-chain fatty acid transport protein